MIMKHTHEACSVAVSRGDSNVPEGKEVMARNALPKGNSLLHNVQKKKSTDPKKKSTTGIVFLNVFVVVHCCLKLDR